MSTPHPPQDQMQEFLLARIAALESIVMLLWNELPNRSSVRDVAKTLFSAEEANGLASSSEDIPVAIRALANQSVFDRVFRELLSGSDAEYLRIQQSRSGNSVP